VPGAIKNGYNKDNGVIAFIGLIFVITFIPINFPANFVIDKGGLKLGILVGMALGAVGMWIKALININFAFVYLG